ncbi:MAG: DoxX family protein [Nocardioidaceae bacterium]
MTVTRMLARPMLASIFVVGGVNAFKNADKLVEKAEPVTGRIVPAAKRVAPSAPVPTDTKTLIRTNAAFHVLGGLALATGRAPRLVSLALAGSMVPTTLAAHSFWQDSDPETRSANIVGFFKNMSLTGGLLLASVDTEGKPGLAWRAKHAATDVRREARHLRKTAKREAKRARKSL